MIKERQVDPMMNAKLNRKGLTLVEVMIALVVLLLVSLALMQTALVSIDANMTNILRDEAVGIAEMRMNEARNTPFDSLASDITDIPITRNIRNITGGFSYITRMTVANLNTDNRQVDIQVGWTWKGENYNHRITSIVRRP
jgi:prepilin-type N-terminal cleavage/methylation domain-containing protein